MAGAAAYAAGPVGSPSQQPPNDTAATASLTFTIPRISTPPLLEDFVEMRPVSGATRAQGDRPGSRGLARVDGFIQRFPHDGEPATQPTEVYAGYDDNNIYFIFVAHDSEPEAIRARMSPREDFGGDDSVAVVLDTFHDQRRGYAFRTNPFGVQLDSMWTEGQGDDISFDTVWDSEGMLTAGGYVVRIAIPFKSLRFPPTPEQRWGVIFFRAVPRGQTEDSNWPRVSSDVEGLLTQGGILEGIRDISPGRNVQIIPYGTFRSYKAIDPRGADGPEQVTDAADPAAGADLKSVFADAMVLDLTLNPDYSQVESDWPQVTVNQRFEVYYPERRPFFIENANYFRTPLNLVFTRRIADPLAGGRLTGRAGPWSIGALIIDDQAPGKLVPEGDPLHGERAGFAIARVNRDIGEHATLGAIYTHRRFEGRANQVGAVDGRIRINDRWSTSFQAATSATEHLDGGKLAGPAYLFSLERTGRSFSYATTFYDIGRDFRTEVGFVPRTDIRDNNHFLSYLLWPESEVLTRWGFELFAARAWDHDGVVLGDIVEPSIEWTFAGPTHLEINFAMATERLRAEDHPALDEYRQYPEDTIDIEYSTSYWDWFNVGGNLRWGDRINLAPPAGEEPSEADWRELNLNVTFRPLTRLRNDNRYLYTRLAEPGSGDTIFTDHILSSRWNWQFNRELSLRAILQYESTQVDEELTSLDTDRRFNVDLLVTYRLNPWTAFYAGINSNARNLDLIQAQGGNYFVRRPYLINDAYQFFLKMSYLVRF
jgi:hypothetical protein